MIFPDPTSPSAGRIQDETRQLGIMWGLCCCSPVIYLSIGWLLAGPLKFDGMFPLPPEIWQRTLVGAGVMAVALQIIHVLVKLRYKAALEKNLADPVQFMKVLTKRSFILIAISELPVFVGFCLFCIQGTLTSIFGLGIISMLLYAQSHPHSANPMYPQNS